MTIAADAGYADALAGLLGDAASPGRRRVLELMGDLLEEASRRDAVAERPTHEELLAGHRLDQQRRGLMAATISNRRRKVGALLAWLAPRHVLDATVEDVQSFLDGRALGNTARRDYISHFRSFYGWCVKQGFLTRAPTDAIDAPKRRVGLPKPLTDAELALVLDPARFDSAFLGRRLRALLCLGALEGLRAQEIAGLHVEDVDLVNGTLRVRRGKGAKQRALPLHPEVRSALEALPMPADGPVFRNTGYRGNADPMNPWRVSQLVNGHLHGLGLDATCHCLRHTFATNIYRSTQDLRLTQELLGHSSPATTAIYAAADMTKASPAVMALRV